LLPSFVVDTNESLRQRALRLVTLGCSQKILAAKMGMQASTFSRWLNQKDEIGPVSVTALDGFNAYLQELAEALADDGHSLAVPLGSDDEINSVSGARRAAVDRATVDIERLAGEPRQTRPVGKSPRPTRTARKHAAKTRAVASGHGAAPGKHRR
jgi:transcriptional regulator with XRE-family HTH domain